MGEFDNQDGFGAIGTAQTCVKLGRDCLDRIDRQILVALQDQPSLSAVDLAERVGLSHTPCWRRLKRLESEGVIVGRALLLDAAALGLCVDVFAEVQVARHDEATLEALERAVLDLPEIVECYSMSGRQDYLMRIVAADTAAYERFLKKVLLHLPGVAHVNSSVILRRLKSTTKLPIAVG